MVNKRGDIARLRRKMRVRKKVVGHRCASAGLRISQQQAYLCAGDFGRSGKNSGGGIDAVRRAGGGEQESQGRRSGQAGRARFGESVQGKKYQQGSFSTATGFFFMGA